MKKSIPLITTAVVLVAFSVLAAASEPAFEGVLQPYEKVRKALVDDDFAALQEPALELVKVAGELRQNLTAQDAGVPAEKLDEVKELLPEIKEAASDLAAASDLEAARDAFYTMSKALVRWRQAAGEGPAVVYCSMKKRSWLQPAEDGIGNPYYGHKMATCGTIVSN